MAREFTVCGLGNALVDIFLELTEPEFAELGFEKGATRLVEKSEQHELLTRFHAHDPRMASGGSVANSIIGFSQLGGKAAFIGCVGDDRYGLFYQHEFEHLGIDFGNSAIVNESTGTVVCVITPDAERTMRTCLAVSSHFSERHIDEARIQASEWLFIEGYLFANPATGQGAIRHALELAKRHGVKVAITCSDAFVVDVFGDAFFEALKQADLIFCNAVEAQAVTKSTSPSEAFTRLKGMVPACVVTDGPHGAYVRFGGEEVHVPAFACDPKDLTGAGDMFAGSFLYGVTHGVRPADAARAANFLAMKVISQLGARLHHGTRDFWKEALASGR
jgi:sugar/nucleoside kinase (ribokinase family)